VKYYKKLFLFIHLYFFFFYQPTGLTRGLIFTRDSSKDLKSPLFGVLKLKLNLKPQFIFQNRQIFAQNGTVFFD